MSREQDYISEARIATRQLWDAYHKLRTMQTEYNALDYGSQLDAGEGDNEGITAAEVGAVVFDTANAIKAVLDAGHATNLAKLL